MRHLTYVATALLAAVLSSLGSAAAGDELAAAALEVSLSVEEAYAAIPHRRTPFEFEEARLSPADRTYLEGAFALIDEGIRLRVATWRDLDARPAAGAVAVARLDALIEAFEALAPPAELEPYQRLVAKALSEQRGFFEEWAQAGEHFDYRERKPLGAHPRVRAASSALKGAYGILMRRYPRESARNRQAFFDYHCALDFI
jgi:hypothetical protein